MTKDKNKKMALRPGIYCNAVGPDGAGKDTVMDLVLKELDNYVLFREPGGTPEAEMIREILLTLEDYKISQIFSVLRKSPILPKTRDLLSKAEEAYEDKQIDMMEVYLYAASRSETSEKVVKKGLQEGKAVIGSRSVSCSMAYQGGARGIDKDFIWETNQQVIDRLPDFEIFFDVPTDVAMARISGRTGKQDRLDLESEEFHRKSRQGYLDFFEQKKYPVFRVDASKTVKEVVQDVLEIIEKNAI